MSIGALLAEWAERLGRLVFVGPDPVDEAGEPELLETLLPWPMRLLLVAGTWLVAFVWHTTGAAQQLAWGLAYVGAIAVSVAVSFAVPLLLFNVALAALWILVSRGSLPDPHAEPWRYQAHQLTTFVNRQAGHVGALWTWSALALTWTPKIHVQLPFLAAVVLLGEPIINGFAQWRRRRRLVAEGQDPAAVAPASKRSGDLHWERRPLIYAATLLGLVILTVQSLDSQVLNVLPLAIAIAAGDAVRWWRHLIRNRRLAGDPSRQQAASSYRQAHRRWSRRADVGFGPGLVIAGIVAAIAGSLWARGRLASQGHAALNGALPPRDTCAPEPGGPTRPQLSLFLFSDTQLRELGGKRFPGQMELADALVPVALRPVELDMLSSSTVASFAKLYDARAKETANLRWAHLGDLADIGCEGELRRATELFQLFPKDQFLGLAAGNHDMSFTGNFFWSPFWGDACPSGRLDKWRSNELLLEATRGALGARGGKIAHHTGWPGFLGGRGGALSIVSPVGEVEHRGKKRGLLAVFLDTSDGGAFDWGIAGSFGTFSRAQADDVSRMVKEFQADAGSPQDAERLPASYADPLFLVFAHHTLGGMESGSGGRLRALLVALDGGPGKQLSDPRVLALVTAHTHHAESHRHCIGRRVMREIVVGSSTDPPQQAAWVDIGQNAGRRLAMRLQTMPLVARTGLTCDTGPTYGLPTEPKLLPSAAECRAHIARLRAENDCAPLFEADGDLGRDCAALERPVSTREQLEQLTTAPPPFEPEEILSDQRARGANLLRCACRPAPVRGAGGAGGAKGAPPAACAGWSEADPFREEAYASALAGLQKDPIRAAELACLAWAAAAVQQHKGSGMTYAEALRCAFDDPSLPTAQETVAVLEARACR